MKKKGGKMAPAFFKKDKLVIISNGEVIDFDPEVIEAARKEVAERKGFYESHCMSLGDSCCSVCQMAGCPIADQG
jgi:Fe2+ or Zn2+ uptake regulation protein